MHIAFWFVIYSKFTYKNTWQDEICEIIEGPPSDLQSKGDIKKCFRTTGVVLFISCGWKTQQVPFLGIKVQFEICFVLRNLVIAWTTIDSIVLTHPISSILRQFSFGIYEFNVELVSLVSPTAKFHIALLIVERKPSNVDLQEKDK